jgi:acyl-CoA dehydrogenase
MAVAIRVRCEARSMSDLTDSVEKLFAQHCTDKVRLAAEAGIWPEALWQAVEAAGLPLALVDTGEASLGVSVQDAFDIARIAGAHAAPIPLPETMLANWLLARAALPAVAGPAVYGYALGIVADADTRVRRELPRIPWGRQATVIVGYRHKNDHRLRLCPRAEMSVLSFDNIAKEPRDTVALDMAMAGAVKVNAGPSPLTAKSVQAAAAALRTAQMAGAIEAATRLTVGYVKTRVQFGKPLGKFQAIQQQVAVLAEQAALARAAADMAADAFARGIDLNAIAAAKTVVGEAANVTANIAHQMHGAIGFSQAYALQHLTRRLWSWRDDDGNEADWASHLGSHLMSRGPDQLWAEITAL